MINLELYKIFVLVAKEGNLTRASQYLNLTQPAVTKSIKKLEELLKFKVFERSNYGIKLTPKGKILYDEIKDAVNLLVETNNKYLNKNSINLGIHSTILNRIFGKCITEYYKNDNKTKINTFNFRNSEMLEMLKNKELDIIFSKKVESFNNDKEITFIKLGVWNDVLVVNKNSKLLNKKIKIDELKKETLYMPRKSSVTTMNFIKSANCEYDDFNDIKHITYSAILEIVKDTNAVGLITKEFFNNECFNDEIRILDTDFVIEPVEFGIYLNNNRFTQLNKFIEVIKNHFKNS